MRPASLSHPKTHTAESHDLSDPAVRLLAEAPLVPGAAALLMECGGPVLTACALGFSSVICHNSSYPLHQSCLESAHKLGLAHVQCLLEDIPRAAGTDPDPVPNASPHLPVQGFDTVFYRLGRATAQINAALREAFKLLRPGGQLLVAGHNREGIKSFAKRAEGHFGNMAILEIKSSCRLLRFQKETPDPVEPVPDPAYFEYFPLELPLADGTRLPYLTKPGIFSYRATDVGTALLARHLPDCAGMDVLDLGCGSGVLSLAAFRLGAKSVLALDVNAIAVACARENFKAAGWPGEARCAYLTEGVERAFDHIFSNPPFHQGSDTDFTLPEKILDACLGKLKPGGRLFLVANQFLDYRSPGLKRFAAVDLLAREKGYAVYRMQNPPA